MAHKVITPVAEEPITLAEARLQCKVDDDNTEEDTFLEGLITAAREVAEHYTGLALAPQTLEMALDAFPGNDAGVIALELGPVSSVISVKYTDTAGVEQTLSNTKYSLSLYGLSRNLSPVFAQYWPSTQAIPDAVRIRYVTGYEDCPKAAKRAMLLMIAWLYENRGDAMAPDDIQPAAAKSLLNTIKVWGF